MNADNFPDFLEQPSHLFQMPYEELKSLVMQYPYCQNLWYLLLKKSMLENHRDFDRNLHMASTVSPDRAYLFQQIRKVQLNREVQENYELSEDFLELMDINEVRATLEAPPLEEEKQPEEKVERLQFDPGPPIPDEDIPAPAFSVPSPVPPEEPSVEEELASIPFVEEEAPVASEPVSIPDIDHLVQDLGTGIDLIAELPELLATENESVTEVPAAIFSIPEGLVEDMLILRSITDGIDIAPPVPTPEPVEEIVMVQEPVPEESHDSAEEETVQTETTVELEVEQRPIHPQKASPPSSEKTQKAEPTPAPLPKASFSSWLKQFQPPQVSTQLHTLLETERADQNKKKKKKRKKKKPLELELAQKSVEDNEVVSETLAWLLTSQGHYLKALHTYEVLLRNQPERSEYFSKKIQEVRNKMGGKG